MDRANIMNHLKTPVFLDKIIFTALLAAEPVFNQHADWLVYKDDQALWHFERKTGLRYPYQKRKQDALSAWNETIKNQQFWELDTDFTYASGKVSKETNYTSLILETATGRVWHWFEDWGALHAVDAQRKLAEIDLFSFKHWSLPNKAEFLTFHKPASNPVGTGSEYGRLYGHNRWLVAEGGIDLDNQDQPLISLFSRISPVPLVFGYHDLSKANLLAFWNGIRKLIDPVSNQPMQVANRANGLLLDIPDFVIPSNQDWQDKRLADLWEILLREDLTLVAEDRPEIRISPKSDSMEAVLMLDYAPCRLPELEAIQLTDPNKGLWELHGEDAERLTQLGCRGRDPAKDVRYEWVGIDFGTSSTVVAVSTPQGGKKLLRVGVRDHAAPVQACQFENPTVLEFLDLEAFLQIWSTQVYRPALRWDWVCAANEALVHFRDHARNPRMVNSVMLYLKRWARECEHTVALIVDQVHGKEYELTPLRDTNPVRGQPMQPDLTAPLDVVELYAWYLGMVINWRQHGLYLKYALTFPVKYESEVRQKILASFRRGLQRSLPESLVRQSVIINDFEVIDIGTEPMAYAAAMLPALGLAPTQEGLSYAVFDFGGGTTDFDFGRWRLPLPAEADEGIESVLERLAAGGDPYLGGENLLALMAYQVVQDNLTEVQKNKLVFVRPSSESAFVGSEAVLDQSALAQANTAMLMHLLRALLESPESFSSITRAKVSMRNRAAEEVALTLEINVEGLEALLQHRVARGVESFVSEMQAAFAEQPPAQVHILLAGNASRGQRVMAAFDVASEAWQGWVTRYFGSSVPEFVVHFAPAADETEPFKPSCKTAVALGALDLVPGSTLVWRDLLHARSEGNAPFNYFVGGLVQNVLQPVFVPGCAYGEWHELGIVREGVFVLASSASPRARSGMKRGEDELELCSVRFADASKGFRCFARVNGPVDIELVTAASRDALERGEHGLAQQMALDGVR
jgi:hypothetical protein